MVKKFYELFAGDYEGSDNEYDNNENCEFGLRHWERGDQPIISFVKKEKVNILSKIFHVFFFSISPNSE